MKFRGTKLSKRTLALLAAALIMIGGSGFTGTKAALTVFSPDYDATIETNSIDVSLTEMIDGGSTTVVPDEGTLTLTDQKFAIGKTYKDSIGVLNSGDAEEYVRVLVRKYWVDKDQEEKTDKTLELKPEWIELTAAEGWNEVKSDNPEYSIYYLSSPLGVGEHKELFTNFRISDKIKSSGKVITVKSKVDGEDVTTEYTSEAEAIAAAKKLDKAVITYSYTYDGCTFNIEAEAQSVQTHHYEDAMKSVWGVDASEVL